MNPLFPVLGIGAVAALLLGGKRKDGGAAPPSEVMPPIIPPNPNKPPSDAKGAANEEWKEKIGAIVIKALQSMDPKVAEAAASQLDAMQPYLPTGLRDLASQGAAALRKEAQAWREAQITKEPPTMDPPVLNPGGPLIQSPAPKAPAPASPKPEAPIIVPTPAPPAAPPKKEKTAADREWERRRDLALALATHLMPYTRYKERKDMVKAYQMQEGLSPDGEYGVNTGLSMLKYNVVPAKPYYFSGDKAKTRAAKQQWTAELTRKAQEDPARRALWLQQAEVANL